MIDSLLGQDGLLVYVGLFLLLMGGAFGLPIPEDIPLILGGILGHRHQGKIACIFAVCYAAIILGDIVIFYAGRFFGSALMNKGWFRARLSAERLAAIKAQLERRSLLTIFVARHLFYVRTATFLACGAVRMRFVRFLIADLFAALISVPLMLALGYFSSEHFDVLLENLKAAKLFSLLLIAAVAAFYLLIVRPRRRRRRRQRTPCAAETEENWGLIPPPAAPVLAHTHPSRARDDRQEWNEEAYHEQNRPGVASE